jgi:hypothetical protein
MIIEVVMMNINPKTHTRLMTIRIEPETCDLFKAKVGERNMSSVLRTCINELLVKNHYLDEVFEWGTNLEEKEKTGAVNLKEDRLYNIEGFYSENAPEDLAINHDRYIYGG